MKVIHLYHPERTMASKATVNRETADRILQLFITQWQATQRPMTDEEALGAFKRFIATREHILDLMSGEKNG